MKKRDKEKEEGRDIRREEEREKESLNFFLKTQ